MSKLTAEDCIMIRNIFAEEMAKVKKQDGKVVVKKGEFIWEETARRVPWTPFETDKLTENFDSLVRDLAFKFGRSEISIMYKVAHLLKARAVRVF